MLTVFCRECKTEIDRADVFCKVCGADQRPPSLRPATSAPPPVPKPEEPYPPIFKDGQERLTVSESKESPSSLSAAKGIVCGVLALIGLGCVLEGFGTIATSQSPVEDFHAKVESIKRSGGLVDQTTLPNYEEIAQIESDAKRQSGGLDLIVGVGALVPMTVLWLSARRSSQQGTTRIVS